ncbi:MAG: primosomal protein N' [Treponema sp.]|jgi:primosomal protein N' (replication factor Y)|nr:primosomal protein N' [Treponema sp.]
MSYFDLVFNIPSGRAFSYREDEKGEADIGKRAMVPFGRRDCLGYIVGRRDAPPPGVEDGAIKPIRRLVDKEPVFDERDLELAKWMAGFYFCGLGEALAAMIPSGKRPGEYLTLADEEDIAASPLDLSPEQRQALEAITAPADTSGSIATNAAGGTGLFYLYGITGSGKTEVFLRAAEAALKEGKSVIYLVPEISLTHQTADAITKRFGNVAATIHSGMSPAARLTEWMRIRRGFTGEGEAGIVVGPRSAVFAPVKNLGLIIIDEEQDASYKSGNTPRYHARQAAMKRCASEGARLVMGSATPSAEAWRLMREGTIKRLDLTRRLSGGRLPEVIPVNLEKTEGCLTPELREEIRVTSQMKRQTILFLNRRGFAYYYHCKSCGYELTCKRCSVSLTWYKSRNKAICHYCGYSVTPPRVCPECGSLEAHFSGFGTEMIEEEVRKTFPELRVLRIDADTTGKKGDLKKALDLFRAGEIDVLLGTQMVAKGLNFPGVRLVGVVLADMGLHLPDFRAAERTFSLVVQVAGRAGRYIPDGKVIVQTLRPHDPAIVKSCALDVEGFFDIELAQRQALSFPPYTRLIRFTFRSRDEERATAAASRLAAIAAPLLPDGADALGPAECPLGIISNQYRRQLLLRGKNMGSLHAAAGEILSRYEKGRDSKVYLEVDVDPVSLL